MSTLSSKEKAQQDTCTGVATAFTIVSRAYLPYYSLILKQG
jgi:hypothetical protein